MARLRFSRSRSIRSGIGGVRRFSLVDPDAEFLLEHDLLADGTQSDALAFGFQIEGVAGSELPSGHEGLGQNRRGGFIEGKLGSHNGIMEWEEPTVNGIWQKNEAGRRRIASAMILGATCAEGVYPDVPRFSVNFNAGRYGLFRAVLADG